MELHTKISNQRERCLVFSSARRTSFMSPYAAADLGKTVLGEEKGHLERQALGHTRTLSACSGSTRCGSRKV